MSPTTLVALIGGLLLGILLTSAAKTLTVLILPLAALTLVGTVYWKVLRTRKKGKQTP